MVLPSKISKVKGYVYIKHFGVLPYETDSNKVELIALGEIYLQAKKRSISAKRTARYIPTPQESKTNTVLMWYFQNTIGFLRKDVSTLLQATARRMNKEIIAFSLKELEEILDEDVHGELKGK